MMQTCEHCGREMSKFTISRHRANCPEQASRREAIRRNLEDPNNPGFIRSERNYVHCCLSPCAKTLMSHFGKWSDVAHYFGLEMMQANERRLADKLEATGAFLRKLSQDLHGGKFGPSLREYEQATYGGRHGAMEKTGLYRRFEDWAGVLQHFGLPPSKANGVAKTAKDDDDMQWLKHRATYVPVEVVLPPWSLKHGFGRVEI